MVVAYLDLLGFSDLLKNDSNVALDLLKSFNEKIQEKVIDEKTHPVSEYSSKYQNDSNFLEYVNQSTITSFKNFISISDSLVIGSEDADLFVKQISNLIATLYIDSTTQFLKSIHAQNRGANDSTSQRKPMPILLRGGISAGDDVLFFKEHHIYDYEYEFSSLNVTGTTYLHAVSLEKTAKGPRLFCDKSFYDALTDKSALRKVSDITETNNINDVYEIVWTMYGCDTRGTQLIENFCAPIQRGIDSMLKPAIQLYKFAENRYPKSVLSHYEKLVELVSCGIVRYADIHSISTDGAIDAVNNCLEKFTRIDKSILRDFDDSY